MRLPSTVPTDAVICTASKNAVRASAELVKLTVRGLLKNARMRARRTPGSLLQWLLERWRALWRRLTAWSESLEVPGLCHLIKAVPD